MVLSGNVIIGYPFLIGGIQIYPKIRIEITVMNSNKLMVGLLAAATAVLGAPINAGFENGLNSWVTSGDVSAVGPTTVIAFNDLQWSVLPNGSSMAALNSNGATASSLDGFFGLMPGTLQSLNVERLDGNNSLTNGAGMYQDLFANAGDTIRMSWNYVARDYIPFNDPAFALLVGPDGAADVRLLSSINSGGFTVGTAGSSGWRSVAFEVNQTGVHRLGFAVTNDGDEVLDAVLFVDDEPGTAETPVLGQTPQNPVLPDSTDGNVFVFDNPNPQLWYDPPYAQGYVYTLTGALFTEFAAPPSGYGYGDLLFEDLGAGNNASFTVSPGTIYALGTPTEKFKISGLPFGLVDSQDPMFPQLFPTYLDWNGVASKLTMEILFHPEPTSGEIPEPGSLLLVGAALAVVVAKRKRLQ